MAGCESGAFTGRDVVVLYAIGCPEIQPLADDYARLGMMRGKSISAEWDTADVTGDMSQQFTKENITTYKSVSFSGDGVSRKEELYGQRAIKRHVYNPPVATSNQPYVWLKIISPMDITEGPFLISKWGDESPYDDAATWSIEAASAGLVDVRDVGAEVIITLQPVDQNLTEGQTLSLSVLANSTDGSALTYQWSKDGADIPGANTSALTIQATTLDDAGDYTVDIMSTTAGSVTSAAATVIIS